MCGIVAAIASREVQNILLEGLKRLEYRGYDSAGMAILSDAGQLQRQREVGKVAALEAALAEHPLKGHMGIAHTRWATHGRPTAGNAHPHFSKGELALVHNGIIENHEALREELQAEGYLFESETDTEVMAHLIEREFERCGDLYQATLNVTSRLEGAFAIAVMHKHVPGEIIGARKGSPLVVGVGIDEAFLASDPLALLQVTDRFIYLREGDIVRLVGGDLIEITDQHGERVERDTVVYEHGDGAASKGNFRHFMQKEIFEQATTVGATLEGRLGADHVLPQAFGADAEALFEQVQCIHIIACGTSYHAGMVARYWLEKFARIPTLVEVASEYRYRDVVVPPGTLFVSISQSGETADTLAALRHAQQSGDYLGSLAICNVAGSSLVRESELSLLTMAGPEIAVASTKATTTQLTALMLMALSLRQIRYGIDETIVELVEALRRLPKAIERTLTLNDKIEQLSRRFVEKQHALFLGRGAQFPIALEGALKLKEISYIHAEAYPAGELKHGPLALVDSDMPVIVVAPNDELLEKLKSNLQEVRSRGGQLFVFANEAVGIQESDGVTVFSLTDVDDQLAPIIYTIPLQLLAYHIAVMRGTDVDQPRNLAKSVTVE
ncbi:glutamine--fructose-6-phosphate transaminase (isomerizing) [Carnimonas nigrificans]|uniref:glutamine--fructose-6-phosphate transaminase (isomerizing) n=1 Tax=Carnimonas nigrificans TaxID=64323 RepID=UPI00046F5933|nr:glutamine--fructose-6-phosphate transaminase (isomerizing) [Carnimonas nigrificans]